MDATQSSRISTLAKSLKDLHVVSTMEEAYAKAREIVLGTAADEKPIGELFREQLSEGELRDLKASEEKEHLDEADVSKELRRVEAQLREQERKLDEAHAVLEKAKAALHEKRKPEKEYWPKQQRAEPAPKVEEYDVEQSDAPAAESPDDEGTEKGGE